MAIAVIWFVCGLSYRLCQGLAVEILGGDNAPDHVTLYRRISAISVDVRDGLVQAHSSTGTILLVPDGTGLAPSTRGDWICCKYKIKRGLIRLSIMISQETREILAVRVTDERTGDSPQFDGLLNDSLENLWIDPMECRCQAETARAGGPPVGRAVEVRADGCYDT